MLAAQMEKSADKAVAAVAVIIRAARPIEVIREKLEHQIEQLHRFSDIRFKHGLIDPVWSDAGSIQQVAAACVARLL
jgi:hypothetical protein